MKAFVDSVGLFLILNNFISQIKYGDALAWSPCYLPSSPDIFQCYCDETCKIYDDCCENSNYTLNTSERLFTCHNLAKLNTSSRDHAYVFDRCPSGTNERLKQLCERPVLASEGPARSVVVASSDSRLFRNMYCALCHEVNILEPKIKLRCQTSNPQFERLKILV